MKRFLIALFICLVPFGARANFLTNIFNGFFGTDDAVKKMEIPEDMLTDEDKQTILNEGFIEIDKKLRDYIDSNDYRFIEQHGTIAEIIKENGFYDASYNFIDKGIRVRLSYYENATKEELQVTIHHEVQHMKDYYAWEKQGSSGEFFDNTDLTTRLLTSAITEARAYTEEIVFVYNKMKNAQKQGNTEEAKKWEKAYLTEFTAHPDLADAFRDAIEDGKSVEQARHIAAVALLNSEFFEESYIGKLSNSKKNDICEALKKGLLYENDFHASSEYLVRALQYELKDGFFTIDDLYQADRMWANICQREEWLKEDRGGRDCPGTYDETTKEYLKIPPKATSNECIQAKKRFENKCNNALNNALDTVWKNRKGSNNCTLIGKVAECERRCGPLKKVIQPAIHDDKGFMIVDEMTYNMPRNIWMEKNESVRFFDIHAACCGCKWPYCSSELYRNEGLYKYENMDR